MRHYCDDWIHEWCDDNGWTEPVMNPINTYWAFPPNAVMPEPIPFTTLRMIKAQKGLTPQESGWVTAAIAISALCMGLSYWLNCPMPLLAGFAFAAFVVASLEVEE